jgi:perosamine synthetase
MKNDVRFVKIPLAKMYYDDKIKNLIDEVLKSGKLVNGEYNLKFEQEWSRYCNQSHSICVNSGTFALLSAFSSLMDLGKLEKEDEILVPSHTFIASISPIVFLGLVPRFIDIDENTYCISPDCIQKAISKKTKAILCIDLYGRSPPMDIIKEIADKFNLLIIEDACQAHGSKYKGKKPGYYSNVTVYSLYPSKNLSVLGEGGIITTNDEKINEICKAFRNYGILKNDIPCVLGLNGFLSEVHAAIGLSQICQLDKWNQHRQEIANLYIKRLNENPGPKIIKTPIIDKNLSHVYHLFVIQANYREKLMDYLLNKEIQTKIHYKTPLHVLDLFKNYKKVQLPVTEKISNSILSLPMSQFFTFDEINYVIDCIQEFYKNFVE